MSKKQLANNRKILITGGAGFIGSYLAEKLADENQVTIFDNFRRNAIQYLSVKSHKNLKLVKGDVLDVEALQQNTKDKNIVMHLAAVAGVSSYYKNPLQTLEVDALGTYNVLRSSYLSRVDQVILFSTSEVYGPNANDVSEESLTQQGPATDSRWSYAVGKLIGDHFAYAFSKMTGLNITILRPFNIYGPRQVGEGAIQLFIKQALLNEPLQVRGDGSHIRAWCYIDDFVSGVISCLGNLKAYNQIFNIGNPTEPISVTDLAQRVISIAKSSSTIVYDKKSKISDVLIRVPNVNKAVKVLKYNNYLSLDEGLAKAIIWYKNSLNQSV
jgi:dTDP-glucose 4,6-dehydratase